MVRCSASAERFQGYLLRSHLCVTVNQCPSSSAFVSTFELAFEATTTQMLNDVELWVLATQCVNLGRLCLKAASPAVMTYRSAGVETVISSACMSKVSRSRPIAKPAAAFALPRRFLPACRNALPRTPCFAPRVAGSPLKCRLVVVVETTHEAWVDRVGDIQCAEVI